MAVINYPQLNSAGPYKIGELNVDRFTGQMSVWTGFKWALIGGQQTPVRLIPTPDELDAYPALKHAWEEYLVIRKLLGI
jgi:hypothetical protein